MEKNRSKVFKVIGSAMVLGVAAAVLFGLTGVLRDPAVDEASQAEKARATASSTPPQKPLAQIETPPAPAASSVSQSDGGSDQTVAVQDESDKFPQFDDEPTGS